MPSIDVTNVSHGMTDDIESGDPQAAEVLDNWELDKLGIPSQRPGLIPFSLDYPQLPIGNNPVVFLWGIGKGAAALTHIIAVSKSGNVYAWDNVGPSSTYVWDLIGSGLTQIESYAENGSVPYGLIVGNGSFKSLSAETIGAPDMTSSYTVTPQANDSKNYIYYLHREKSYGGLVFRSNIEFKSVSSASDFSGAGHYHVLGNLPSSSATEIIRIFRTTHNGTIGYHVADISSGATSYTDSTADGNLGAETLYTTNGHVEVRKPLGNLVTSANDTIWYVEGKNLYQCVSNNVGEISDALASTFTDFILALGSVEDYPIIFTRKNVYRVEGKMDAFGNGFHRVRKIGEVAFDEVHRVQNTMVRVGKKLYFIASGGVHTTDGFTIQCISKHLQSYLTKDIYSKVAPSGTSYTARYLLTQRYCFCWYDKERDYVIWPIFHESEHELTDETTYLNALFILDLSKSTRNGQGCFRIWTFNHAGLQVSSLGSFYWLGKMHFLLGEKYGNVLAFDEDTLDDPVAVSGVDYADWERTAIIPDYRSTLFNGGSQLARKWSSKIVAVFEALTNVSIKLYTRLGKSDTWVGMKEILRTGSPTEYLTSKRHFPKKTLRWNYRQVRITKAEKIVANSDDTDTVTLNVVAKTVLLASGTWQGDLIGMSIYFEVYNGGQDAYSIGFVISGQSGDTLTLASISDMDSGSGLKFQVKGYAKDEKLRMLGYSIPYKGVGDAQRGYKVEDAGEND